MTWLFRLFFRSGKKFIKEANQKDIEIRNFTKGNIVGMIVFFYRVNDFLMFHFSDFLQGKIVLMCAYNIKEISANIS